METEGGKRTKNKEERQKQKKDRKQGGEKRKCKRGEKMEKKRGRKAVRRKRKSMKRRKGMRLEGSGEEGAIGKSREEGRHWKKDYMGVKNRIKKGRGKQEGRKCKKGREKGDMGEMGKRKK